MLHYLCFKLVALAVRRYYGLPALSLAAHPHLYGERGLWWLAYTAVGIAVPLLIYGVYLKIKSFAVGKYRTLRSGGDG